MKVMQDERLIAITYYSEKEMDKHMKVMYKQGFLMNYCFEEKGLFKTYYKKNYLGGI